MFPLLGITLYVVFALYCWRGEWSLGAWAFFAGSLCFAAWASKWLLVREKNHAVNKAGSYARKIKRLQASLSCAFKDLNRLRAQLGEATAECGGKQCASPIPPVTHSPKSAIPGEPTCSPPTWAEEAKTLPIIDVIKGNRERGLGT